MLETIKVMTYLILIYLPFSLLELALLIIMVGCLIATMCIPYEYIIRFTCDVLIKNIRKFEDDLFELIFHS